MNNIFPEGSLEDDVRVGDFAVIRSRFSDISVLQIVRETSTQWILAGGITRLRKKDLGIVGAHEWDTRTVAIKGSRAANAWIRQANERELIRELKSSVNNLNPNVLALQREAMRNGEVGPLAEIDSQLQHIKDFLILTQEED